MSIQQIIADGVDTLYEVLSEYLESVTYVQVGFSRTYDVVTDSITGADPMSVVVGFWLGENYKEVSPILSATASYISGNSDEEGVKFICRGSEIDFGPKIGDIMIKDGISWRVKSFKPLPGKPVYIFMLDSIA